MTPSRTIRHTAQYTALVDILFATIGVFVIVFALQDIQPPTALQPASYEHLVLCDADRRLTIHTQGDTPGEGQVLGRIELGAEALEQALKGGGRVLVALAAACLMNDGKASVATQLRALEKRLSDRPATATTPLTLFEFAPLGLGAHGAEALIERFVVGAAS